MNTEYEKNAKIFKALCDHNRLRILELLRSGEKCAYVIQEKINVTQSGLSYHMKILCESGIVNSRQEGKLTYYFISEIGKNNAINLLKQLTTLDIKQEINNDECIH